MSCECEGTREERMARWMVTKRCFNRSAFSGYHRTPSDYSEIHCSGCGSFWRSKARYVDRLPDYDSAYWLATGQYRAKGRVLRPEAT